MRRLEGVFTDFYVFEGSLLIDASAAGHDVLLVQRRVRWRTVLALETF